MIRDLEILKKKKKRTILWASGSHWTSLLWKTPDSVFLNNRSRSYDCAVREKALPRVRNPLVDHSKSLPLQCKPISSPVSGEMGTAAGRLLTRPLWSGAGPSLWSVYHIVRHAGQIPDKLKACYPDSHFLTVFSRFSFCCASKNFNSGDWNTKSSRLKKYLTEWLVCVLPVAPGWRRMQIWYHDNWD